MFVQESQLNLKARAKSFARGVREKMKVMLVHFLTLEELFHSHKGRSHHRVSSDGVVITEAHAELHTTPLEVGGGRSNKEGEKLWGVPDGLPLIDLMGRSLLLPSE